MATAGYRSCRNVADGFEGPLDPKRHRGQLGGWKARGLWATVSTRAPFHMETGQGTTSKVLRFQLRPDPLAR